MPIIKPISDLRNKANELFTLVHKSAESVFITRNGEGDMVLMSLAQYAELQRKLELYGKLAVAEAQVAAGDRGQPLRQVMKTLRKRIRESQVTARSGYSPLRNKTFRTFLSTFAEVFINNRARAQQERLYKGAQITLQDSPSPCQ